MIALGRLLLFLAWAVLPGLALACWVLPRETSRLARAATALALGPPLAGAAMATLLVLGVPLVPSFWILFAVSAVLAVAGLRRAACTDLPAERVAWAIAVGLVALTLAFPIASPWWRVYSDNWGHAGWVRSVEAHVPPLDNGFAGYKLQYAWIYHAFVAGARASIGVDVFGAMVILAALALLSVMLSAASALGRARVSDVAWTLALLGLGLNALFPVFLPIVLVRAFTGEVRGVAELARQFDLLPLQWDTTGVFLRSLSGQDFFLDKFMVATPFALSLAALTAWAASFRRHLEGSGELVACALLTLAAGLMHPVTGVFLGASAGLAWLLGRGKLLPWALATIAGLVPVVLYTKTVIGGAGGTHSELPFDLAPLKVVGYVTCLALGLLFAVKPIARAWRENRAWAAWVIAGLVVALFSRLPGPSPFFTVDKLSYLVWIPLAITAGPAFAAWMRARSAPTRLVLALLLFVPVNGLALASRAFDPHNAAPIPFELAGFRWLRAESPKDAVLLVQPGDWESSILGERDQYYSEGHPTVQLGYDLREVEVRKDLETRFFATGRLTDADRAHLALLERPVYAVWADFNEPLWRWTPGTLARRIAPPGPKPAFDPALPVAFTSPELEIRQIPLP